MTVCIDNAQHPLMIDSGAHCSIVARNLSGKPLPKLGETALSHQGKELKRKGNIRLSPELVVLDDAHIQGFLLGTDYQRMYGIDIYNSENRHITIGTNKEKKSSLDIYHVSTHEPLEELLNELREGQPAFAIGEEPLGKIKGHDIELYLDVERPYPPMLRRPPYPESMETRKEIEKHINELLDVDVIREIGHNEIVKINTPFLITWHDGKSRFCEDFRALNNYTKADRYPIQTG
ncbi:hypothetical protein O181_099564 [Austropuccinia psidii MF-1]|uniref:Peptidase A2 domain-containing protein n=1 Tax=Austropuccinia psidii MF-1 TaxID=1389203 RepID=A0A9Q3PFK4_9BASI|nr:hypothetical protein [Austropuccinia psidii MF-1]